jgi:hypothetical protein
MNILEKFEKGSQNHTYQRIDVEYTVNIFLGYNEDGQMSMVITEFGKEAPVKSSKVIDVKMKRRDDGKIALSFDLLDGAYKTMFVVFCRDMINICEKAGSSMAISNALTRWKYWKEMFGKKKKVILDKQEIKGLIGELIELKEHFLNEWDESVAIASWMGPLLGHKDFEIEDTWYEVKSVSENALQVKISSLEQLESESEGHLVIVRLEDTSTVSSNGINLNDMVLSVISIIQDPTNLELFQTRLDNMGYAFDEEYANYCFLYKGTEYYRVTDSFPRLTRKNVDQAISGATYNILFNAIRDYKEA